MLGTWAEKNVAGLSSEDMDSYEDILNLETVDIFNFIAGNADPPAFVDTPMMARLQVRVPSLFAVKRNSTARRPSSLSRTNPERATNSRQTHAMATR